MAGHAQLKFVMTECSKTQIRLTGLKCIVGTLYIETGADPEILKGGCTKFSGPELPYSGFDPFLNLL